MYSCYFPPSPFAAPRSRHSRLSRNRSPAPSGIAGGLGAANQYDAQHRPITMGGFVQPGQAPVVFEDITKQAGLSGWIHKMGSPEKNFIVETNGSGVCIIDYNNDGWPDIYLVNGATFDSLDGKETPPHAALFRNNHDGTFTDVSKEAGVQNDRWGYGCSVADYDNDGWPDLFVGNYGKSRLYHNNHDGTFTDVAEQAGVALDNWHPGSSWGDYDGDGNLDLYVTGYVHFDRNNLPIGGTKAVGYAQCMYRGFDVNCGPRGLPGEARPSLPQRRPRPLHRRHRPGRRGRQGQVLRLHRHLHLHERRRQTRPRGRQRLRAQLFLRQQRRRHL